MPDDGLVTIRSAHSARDTIARVEAELDAKGVTVFAKIDHAAGASAAGLPLRPTTLLIFGGARAGTPLMQDNQRVGIDLPLKALVWEDGLGSVWLTYNDPAWIAQRHALDAPSEPLVQAMSAMLAAVARNATEAGPDSRE
ncbi:MAG TPA: DUF302 domain-containing protein [Methylocella sp.]|nr:DUF302 domain-containing protein [Methylocella sp.]